MLEVILLLIGAPVFLAGIVLLRLVFTPEEPGATPPEGMHYDIRNDKLVITNPRRRTNDH